jgi:type IV pilus assembly protein PilY1
MLEELGVITPEDQPASVTFFQLLRAALRVVLAPVTGINIGLMLNHENINDCEGQEIAGCSNGGYVAMGFRLLTEDTTEGVSDPVKDAFDALLKSIPPPQTNFPKIEESPPDGRYGNYSHPYQGRELFYEFSLYMRNRLAYNGWNEFTSFDGNMGSCGGSTELLDPETGLPVLDPDTGEVIMVPDCETWPPLASNDRRIAAQEDVHLRRWMKEVERLSLEGKMEAAQLLAQIDGFAPDPTSTSPVGGRTYNGAQVFGECAQLYTINFLFQVSQQDAQSDVEIERTLALGPYKGNTGFEQIIEYLNRTDLSPESGGGASGEQSVVSYFFGDERFLSEKAGARKLDGYAQAGGTGYGRALSSDPDELVAELQNVFSQILSVSTTFTAAALPVNSFDRAQLVGDVFLALFQPTTDTFDAEQPLNRYWWGNVKKLKLPGLNTVDPTIELVDANGTRAIAADGRIERNRVTFWTNTAAPDVQDTGRDPDEFDVAGYDGRSVNRGGSGHRVPTYPQASPLSNPGPRIVYYDAAAGSTLADLDPASPVVVEELSTVLNGDHSAPLDAETTQQMINYIRGWNPVTEQQMDWMMASVMHSRPHPINYGALNGHTRDNPLTYLAVGSNDGVFRFLRNTGAGDPTGKDRDLTMHLGKEAWGFAPRAAMRSTGRIFLPGAPGPEWYDESTIYGVDGAAVSWLDDTNGDGTIDAGAGDEAYVFFGLRRGGKAYYGLDVSDPESPRLMWSIDGEQDADFAELGLAFSDPTVGTLDLDADGVREPVVIFGGGYDRRYDNELAGPPADPLGNAIYVVNAETGALVKKLTHPDMLDSIPSSVAAVDTDGDDLLDRLYVGDLGGRVWRVDIPRPSPTFPDLSSATWPVSLLADLGRHGASEPANRVFFHKTDVVQSGALRDPDGNLIWPEFDAVVITSGSRANPLDTSVPNYAFMLRDGAIAPLSEPLPSGSEIEMDDLADITTVAQEPLDIDRGWRLRLGSVGEKGLAAPLTISNTVFFTTYVPPGASADGEPVCGPAEGTGRIYSVSLFNANPLRDGPIDPWDDSEVDQWYDDLKSGGIPAEVVALPPNRILRPDLDVEPVPATARWRTFWHLEEDPVD